MKIIASSILPIMVATLLAGCSDATKSATDHLLIGDENPGKETGQGAAKKTVALVMKTLTNPFFKSMEKGARKAEEELDVNLLVKTGAKETSIDQQIAIVKDLIAAKVNAIVIAPGSSTELIPVLKEAKDAGIVIINIDNRLDPERSQELGLGNVPFISVDNENGAYLAAKALADRITTPTQAAIIEGIRSARNARDRKSGAMRAFAENPNITVVASESAHWKIDEGHQVTGALLDKHPDIGAIFCANDMMALGAIRYLVEHEKDGVLVASYDNLREAHKVLRKGQLVATIDQQADQQGYLGVSFAVTALRGDPVPAETLVDVKLVTADTLGQDQ